MLAPPIKINSRWSPERLATLRILVAEKLSAGQIGQRMGVSRNAAMGAAFRLGLVVGGGRRGPQPHDQRQAGRTIARREARRAARAEARQSGQATPRPALVQCDGYTDIPPDHSEFAVAFMDVRAGQCRYPVSADGQPFLFCGTTTTETYCPRHDRLCHRHTAPKRSWREGRRERAAG